MWKSRFKSNTIVAEAVIKRPKHHLKWTGGVFSWSEGQVSIGSSQWSDTNHGNLILARAISGWGSWLVWDIDFLDRFSDLVCEPCVLNQDMLHVLLVRLHPTLIKLLHSPVLLHSVSALICWCNLRNVLITFDMLVICFCQGLSPFYFCWFHHAHSMHAWIVTHTHTQMLYMHMHTHIWYII